MKAPPCQCPSPVCPPAPVAMPPPIQDAGTANAVEPSEEFRVPLARFFPGADSARSERKHRPNVVILFAPPAPNFEPGTLAEVERFRLQPILCGLSGKLEFGARCGEAMPAKTKVRLTDSGDSGHEELDVERGTKPFRDTNGGQVYPAPYAPACCMYNTCLGRTLPYFPTEDGHSVIVSSRTVLAVWPADADIELTTFKPGAADDVSLDKAPFAPLPCEKPAQCLVQAFSLGERNFLSLRNGMMGAGIFQHKNKSWQPFQNYSSPRELLVLSATDLDHDGRPELVVDELFANDYGLQVFVSDESKARYGFTCGNI